MGWCSAKGAMEASLRDAEGKGEGEEGVRGPNESEGKELRLRGAKGDVFNAVYYVQGILYTVGHEVTIPYQVQRSVRVSGCMHSSSGVEPGLGVPWRASQLLGCCFRCRIQCSQNWHVTTFLSVVVGIEYTAHCFPYIRFCSEPRSVTRSSFLSFLPPSA